jgi:hypothetical protein
MNGKGNRKRPLTIPLEDFEKKFNEIFPNQVKKHCETCGKSPTWCQCHKKDTK